MDCYHDNVTLLLVFMITTCLLLVLLHVARKAVLRRRLTAYNRLQEVNDVQSVKAQEAMRS